MDFKLQKLQNMMIDFLDDFDYLIELEHFLDVIDKDYIFFGDMKPEEIDEFREFFKDNFSKTEIKISKRRVMCLSDF